MENSSSASLLDAIRRRGRIRIAVSWGNTAEQFLDPDTRAPDGVVAIVGRMLAADLGVEPEFVNLPWSDQIPALVDGRVDICLKHTNRPDRAFLVDFSTGRLEKYEGKIVIRKDGGIASEADLDRPDRIIAATRGAHQEAQVRDRYPRAQLHTVGDAHEGMTAVLQRAAHACLTDAAIPNFLLLHPECSVMMNAEGQPVVTSIDYAHPCIKGGDARFLIWLNNWMDYHAVQGHIEGAIDLAYRRHAEKFDRIMLQQAGMA
jgi:polar amino acid transport system substrate-binding protein